MMKYCKRCKKMVFVTKENIRGVQDGGELEDLMMFDCECGNTLSIPISEYDAKNQTYVFTPEALRLVKNTIAEPIEADDNEDYVYIDGVKWSGCAVIECLQEAYDNNRL